MYNNSLLDDLLGSDFPRPSTSFDANVTDGDFVFPDPFNATEDVRNNTKAHIGMDEIARFIDANSWVVYVGCGLVFLAVIAIMVCVCCWIKKHKTRVIRQDDDPILTSTYETETSWCCRVLCCRPSKSSQETASRNRQNSASNLDPYRRPPLPPIGTVSKPIGNHYNISTFNRLEPLASDAISEKNLAINIQGIRGVPDVPIRREQYRRLPPLQRPS